MEVEYELTPEDLIAFQRYHRQNPPQKQPQGNPLNVFVGTMVLIAVATTAFYFLISNNPTAEWYLRTVPFVGLGVGLGVLGVVLYGLWLSTPRQMLRALKQGRNAEKARGRRRVSIDAEAIRSTSEFAASTYFWHGIDKFGATFDHVFVYVNTTTAVIVPARAFPDDGVFKEFVDTARHYYRMGGVVGEADAEAEGIVAKRRPDETGLRP